MPTAVSILGGMNTIPKYSGIELEMLKVGISVGLSVFLPKVSFQSPVGGNGTVGAGIGVGVGVGVAGGGLGVVGALPVVIGGVRLGIPLGSGVSVNAVSNSICGGLCNVVGGLQVQASVVGLGGVGFVNPGVVVYGVNLSVLVTSGVLLGDIMLGLKQAGVVNPSNEFVMGVVKGIEALLGLGIVLSSGVSLVSPSPPICAPSPVPVVQLPVTAVLI